MPFTKIEQLRCAEQDEEFLPGRVELVCFPWKREEVYESGTQETDTKDS